jgi:hypothetical protein
MSIYVGIIILISWQRPTFYEGSDLVRFGMCKVVLGIGFCTITSGFPRLVNSINDSIDIRLNTNYPCLNKRLQTKQCSFGCRGSLDREVLSYR